MDSKKKNDTGLSLLEKRKKSFLRVLFGRNALLIFSLLLQAAILLAICFWFEDRIPLYLGGSALFTVLVLLILVNSSMDPTAKITWLLIISVLPVFGCIFYVWTQSEWGRRTLKALVARSEALSHHLIAQEPEVLEKLTQEDPGVAGLSRYVASCGNFPVFTNTDVTYFPLGEDKWKAMLRELEKAQSTIYLEYFIVREGVMWGKILEILVRKAQEGLDVRMLYDGTCEFTTLPYDYPKRIEKLGIRCKMFSPIEPLISSHYNYRDHRKILVIDGCTAFTGGVNLADEYINRLVRFGYWKDSGVRLEGPGAGALANIFLTFWKAQYPEEDIDIDRDLPAAAPVPTDCLVQPFADSPVDREAVAKNVYLELINQAQRRLQICTPYLILDNDLLACLRLAAKRGVDVRIYTPGVPDKPTIYQLTRSYFPHLLRAGVRIFSYTPGFLHAKTWLVDDRIAAVGTVNLDYRSLYLHFENSVLIYGGAVLDDVRRDLAEIERESAEVKLADCRTGFFGTMYSAVLRLVAPLC